MAAIFRLTETHGRQTYVAADTKRHARKWFRDNSMGYEGGLSIEKVKAICIASIPNKWSLEATELGGDGNWRHIYCRPLANRRKTSEGGLAERKAA